MPSPIVELLTITGLGISTLGVIIFTALNRNSGASLPNRMWLGIIQRDVLDPIEGAPTDGTYAIGTLSGRRTCVWLGDRGHVSKAVTSGLHKTPCDLRIQVASITPMQFTIFRMTGEPKKIAPPDKQLPVPVSRRELIDAKQMGKPQLEQLLELQESEKVLVYSGDPPLFKQWQQHGEVGFLFNLLYLHSADSLTQADYTLTFHIAKPNSYLLEPDAVKSIIQDLNGLATDLEKNTPNK